ncbi:MAG TPA: hypothetical protein VEA69_23640 [Tepidisphaeraceae bacterium]|nr:hypothetical protein [Tepidisphaeraceae bacterium]
MHVESLEGRAMLSATLVGGVLTVVGTGINDQINISAAARVGKITVSEKTTVVSGNVTTITNLGTTAFDVALVKSVVVRTGDGNDTVTLTGSKTKPYLLPSTLEGGAGHDSLSAGGGTDVLRGGIGNDRLTGNGGNDSAYGESGDDRLFGNDGNDRLYGGFGLDSITGGLGGDLLDGGANNDKLYADDGVRGNDTVEGGGADITKSKTSGDSATVDVWDLVTNSLATGLPSVRRVTTVA